MSEARRINGSRLGRLSLLGRLAGGVAGGALSEGLKQLSKGRRPGLDQLLLTPSNARRLADRLSEMRGAAMKLGQLLSMDGGHLLPAQFSEVLDRLREDAHQMPLGQVAEVLNQAWGNGWDAHFQRFHFKPVAAASIGQVHEAVLDDGRRLAVKLQYPGIRRSIDSDVDNVATLLRLFGLLPDEVDIEALLAEAKSQLHLEADYRHEAGAIERFASRVGNDPRYQVPAVVEALCSADVLAMEYLEGRPVEALEHAPADVRNSVSESLLSLALREVFDWGLVQTDPNFANYRYDEATGRIQLLDFGATRDYAPARQKALRELLLAAVDGDTPDVVDAAVAVGYLGEGDPEPYQQGVVELLRIVTEPARQLTPYRFADNALAQRMADTVVELRVKQGYARLPPTDVLFLHRKLGGLYLLLARLRAKLPVRELLETHGVLPAESMPAAALG